jgi:hypothetical protein
MLKWKKRVKGLALIAAIIVLGSSYALAQWTDMGSSIMIGSTADTVVKFMAISSDSGSITYLSQGSAATGTHAGVGRGVKFFASASTAFPLVMSHGGAQPIVLGTADTERLRVTGTGNVGIGTQAPTQKLHVVGNARFDGTVTGTSVTAQYQDIAEWVKARGPATAGTVLIIDPERTDGVTAASASYDTKVAGVVSPKPGITLGIPGDDKVVVAHSGRVRVKASVENGPIAIGDLLVSSSTPGHAMRSTPVDVGGVSLHRPGTVLGKALEPLADGKGDILVLLMLQ